MRVGKILTMRRPFAASGLVVAITLAGCALLTPLSATAASPAPATAASISAAIATAMKTDVVPSTLTPSLTSVAGTAGAAAHFGQAMVTACDPYYVHSLGAKPQPCVLGDTTSKKVVVLWGDSTAAMWVPALSSAMKTLHDKLLVFPFIGCPSVLTQINPNTATQAWWVALCQQFHKSLPAAIIATHPVAVITTQIAMWGDFSPSAVTSWVSQWTSTFDAVTGKSSAIKRFLIQSTPTIGGSDIAACVALHHSNSACAPHYWVGNTANFMSNYNAYLVRDAAIATASKATVIPVTGYFCQSATTVGTQNVCPAAISNYLVYVDYGHVSTDYMNYLAPALATQLATLNFPH